MVQLGNTIFIRFIINIYGHEASLNLLVNLLNWSEVTMAERTNSHKIGCLNTISLMQQVRKVNTQVIELN